MTRFRQNSQLVSRNRIRLQVDCRMVDLRVLAQVSCTMGILKDFTFIRDREMETILFLFERLDQVFANETF